MPEISKLDEFLKVAGVTLQPWQRPLMEHLMRGGKVRMMTETECRAAQRATRAAMFKQMQNFLEASNG